MSETPPSDRNGTDGHRDHAPGGEAKTFETPTTGQKLRKRAGSTAERAKANADAAKRSPRSRTRRSRKPRRPAERIRAEAEVDASGSPPRLCGSRSLASSDRDEDADLFLTGSDEETLTKQAEAPRRP
jgi:hypothetical protein